MRRKTDYLVIGTGIAGLSFALKAANYGSVVILSKVVSDETNTRYAQGGIAAVTYPPDTDDKHIEDTFRCGSKFGNKEIVASAVHEAPDRIKELIELGVQFDKDSNNKYKLGKEGGHSERRVLHHKDNTGLEIQEVLLRNVKDHPNIELIENQFAIDLITRHHLDDEVYTRAEDIICYGAYVLNKDTNEVDTWLSKTTLLATGGCGDVYLTTTNPSIATGDGIAMIYRAKGMIDNMEFIQFHPTSLYNPGETPSFLITEAIRGFGGILKTIDGKEFMSKYDRRGSLAPRDIVAQAIDNEMKVSGDEYVCVDCRHLNKEELQENFPNIYKKCLTIGIDITKDMIPVIPAAHYVCGGIKTDEYGQTTIENLYASGECASSGMHGANRLASNSLLEALVFSHRAAIHSSEQLESLKHMEAIPDWDTEGTVLNEEMILITQTLRELQSIMSNYVGIVRSNLRLKRALDRLEIIHRETEMLYKQSILSVEICELRNRINVAYLIIKMAMERKQSIGLHYTLNYPPL